MTEADLQAIEAAATAATPGPWTADPTEYAISAGPKLIGYVTTTGRWGSQLEEARANTRLMAGSRIWVPQLVAEVRRLWAERDEQARHVAALREDLLARWVTERLLRAELVAARQQQARELHEEQEG